MTKTTADVFICKTAGEAITLVSLARLANLPASYLPVGGTTPHRTIPITHRVCVVGTKAELSAIKNKMVYIPHKT